LPSLLDGSPLGCTRAATLHDGAVREAIHALKYSARPGLAAPLAELILSVDPPLFRWQEYQALVPIPLHRVREAERGFNQAGRIARALSKSLGVPVQGGWLRRTRATPPLAGPGGYEERALKVRGAFRARLPPDAAGCSVLLVDDVLTTGATTSEAARVLVEARAGRVDAVAVARALPANGSDGAPAR
jgi:ComF family protein